MVQPQIAETPNQVQEVAEAFQASEVECARQNERNPLPHRAHIRYNDGVWSVSDKYERCDMLLVYNVQNDTWRLGRLYGHHADTNPKFITHATALENARLALADW